MPSPHKRSFAAEELARRQKKRPATIVVIVIAVVFAVIAIGYALFSRFIPEKEPVSEKKPSIAVLAFDDMSPQKDQEWFCDGISDAIINALTPVDGLDVIARHSSFQYKGKPSDIREVGRALGVDYVLEGSVLKADSQIRITAQLVKVSDQSHILSEAYNREMKDVLDILDEISLKIVDTLKVKLLGDERKAVEKRYTNNPEAWQLYLLGKNSKAISFEQRIDYYRKAIELDPQFALAYVATAWSYNEGAFALKLTIEEAQQKVLLLLDKALALDENLAEAHALLATLKTTFYEWDGAEQEYKKAIQLNPGSAEVHLRYASFLGYMMRCEEALVEIKLIQKLNPLDMTSYAIAIRINIMLGRYDDALEEFNRGRAIDPNNGYIYQHLGRLYRKQGRYADAIEAFKKQYELYGITGPNFNLGYTYALMGEREKAEHILNELLQSKKEGYGLSLHIALLYIALGDYDKAFSWLDRGYEEHDFYLQMIKSDYEYDPIRSDPRYKVLLKKINLAED